MIMTDGFSQRCSNEFIQNVYHADLIPRRKNPPPDCSDDGPAIPRRHRIAFGLGENRGGSCEVGVEFFE